LRRLSEAAPEALRDAGGEEPGVDGTGDGGVEVELGDDGDTDGAFDVGGVQGAPRFADEHDPGRPMGGADRAS
jgi:hypothetical protein